MATSKETRVRVEGFSKIMASTAPGRKPKLFRHAALALDRSRGVDDGAQRLAVQSIDIEEMLGGHGRSTM